MTTLYEFGTELAEKIENIQELLAEGADPTSNHIQELLMDMVGIEDDWKEKAKNVKCPIIKESPVAIECKVKEIKELGSHHMFVAEILSIDADDKYIDENGAFDISKCD